MRLGSMKTTIIEINKYQCNLHYGHFGFCLESKGREYAYRFAQELDRHPILKWYDDCLSLPSNNHELRPSGKPERRAGGPVR
jgi:hypothetical protein